MNTLTAFCLNTRLWALLIMCSCICSHSDALVAHATEPDAPLSQFLNESNSKLDSIGDPLPDNALMRFGTLRFQLPSSCNQMLLSPDGKYLITLLAQEIICWDAATGKSIWRQNWGRRDYISGPGYGQCHLAFSKDDSSQFYVAAGQKSFNLWDTKTGKSTKQVLQRGPLPANFARGIISVDKSIDIVSDASQTLTGSQWGVGLYDKQGKELWFVKNEVQQQHGPGAGDDRLDFFGEFSYAKFTPDESQIVAVMSEDRKALRVMDKETGKTKSKITTTANVVRMTFDPDSRFVYTTERDCGIRCYSLESSEMTWELALEPDAKGAESYASAIACSPDGSLIAAATPIGPKDWVHLLNARTGEVVRVLKSCGWKPWAVQFAQDGKTLFCTGWSGTISRWEVATGERLPLPVGIPGSAAVTLAKTKDRLAFSDGEGSLRIVNSTTGVQTHELPQAGAGAILFSPSADRLSFSSTDGDQITVKTWDFESDRIANTWKWDKGRDSHSDVNELATDSEGKMLAACVFRQSRAYCWNTKTGKQVGDYRHPSVYGLDLSKDGSRLVTVGWDKTIRLWNTNSGARLATLSVVDEIQDPVFQKGDPRMYGVRFSPDEQRIAVCHMDGHVSIWDSSSPDQLTPITHFTTGTRFSFGAIDWSPSGIWLALGTGAGDVLLLDSYTGQRMYDIGKHQRHVYTVRFGKTDHRLVSGGGGLSYLWALDQHDATDQRDFEQMWKQLQQPPVKHRAGIPLSSSVTTYRAMLQISSTPDSAIKLLNRIKRIEAVGSFRGPRFEDPDSPLRKAMTSKAEREEKFEMDFTVHRAILALKMSRGENVTGHLNWLANSHPSKAVRQSAQLILGNKLD